MSHPDHHLNPDHHQARSERAPVSLEDVRRVYDLPFLELVFQAATVHRRHFDPREVQLCTLLSVKTGGCPEDCAYCPQSARYNTGVRRQGLLDTDEVLARARAAREAGSTRFCMGAAWREVKDNQEFERVLEMVKGVGALGLEVCCTMGMLSAPQAKRLKEAGLTAYNHNLDSSEGFYGDIIHTRSYQDRLRTIAHVADAGISVCCGGIIGMGESTEDRLELIRTLANLDPQPESVPINALVPVEGTPLADRETVEPLDWIRMIALARIFLPRAMVRLSAGRLRMSAEAQALAFMAGANSIFTGEKLLTTPNPDFDVDRALLDRLGLRGRAPAASPGGAVAASDLA